MQDIQLKTYTIENHVFSFPNRFTLKKFNTIYGLCGGMCFTSLDLFHEKQSTPNFTHPDQLPKQLFNYLVKRQVHSNGFRFFTKMSKWLFHTDETIALKSLNYELPRIQRELLSNRPVPIVVIRSRKFQNPTLNHQILVVGIKQNSENTVLTTYDPNYANCLTALHISKAASGFEFMQSTGEKLRGFFVNNYKKKHPPKMHYKRIDKRAV